MKRLLLLFVAILAFLSGYAQGGYNPENPADPNQYRRLTVTASPKAGGSVSPESRLVGVGETVTCTAYPHQYHEFAHWEKDGVVVAGNTVSSDDYYDDYYGSNTYTFVMPDKDVEVVAVFKANYNPGSPQDPGANVFVEATGEMIIDKFTPGNLSVAISSLVGYESGSQIQTLLVCGVMGEYDFYCLRDLPNCSKIDLSRTSGFSEIPYYTFSGASSLTDLLLPSCVSHINGNAFEGCGYLFELTCHALVPPTLADDAFAGVGSSLVVRVPEQSVDLYKNAKGWKAYTILPIQEDIVGITVSLPNGISAKDFRGMWLELTNTKSGQRLHYVMTDRRQYTFPNIISNTTWNIVLRNERGDVFGQIDNVEVGSEDVSVTFAALSKPQTVTLHVLTPDGTDVTTQTQVTWLDADGNYLAQSTTMGGLCVGKKLVPRITLQKDLAITYTAPQPKEYTVVETSNNIVCRLEEITEVTLSGKVTDESTRSALSGVYVSASQTFAGKHSKTVGTKTDAKGNYALTVLNVPTTLSVASSDYISQTFVCDMPMDGSSEVKLEDVVLKPITGATISINFTYTPSVAEGEEASVQEWYSDYNNVTYTIYNKTKARAISQYSVQYPRIVLLEDVDEGDVLEVTASSVTSSFVPVKATATIDAEQHALAGFDIVALGGFKASFKKTGNAAVVGSLYDGNGKLVKAYNYSNTVLTVSDLADGRYTLVTMGSGTFFNEVYDLSQLPQTGLELGTDYVRHEFDVKSGVVSVVNIEEVPVFNESKFYYTGDNTSFTVNKTSIVAGNYLTLSARIDFKRAYATNVSNLNLIVDLPESCQFVENSVMVGNRLNHYSLDGNRLTIPVARYTDRIRFCVIPTLGGEYAPSALVDFMLDGEEKVQPIGNASYSVKDWEIQLPAVVAKASFAVSGLAPSNSKIRIYDDNTLIGETMALANGQWSATCNLIDPYNLSKHKIYSLITTVGNTELKSETVECMYDANAITISKVTMINTAHPAASLELCEYVTIFDFQNPDSHTEPYWYWPDYPDFTFLIDFTDNNPEKVSNVILYVHTTSSDIVKLIPKYDEKLDKWIATSKFYSNSLPANVSLDFDANLKVLIDEEQIKKNLSLLSDIQAEMNEYSNSESDVYEFLITQLSKDSIDYDLIERYIDEQLSMLEDENPGKIPTIEELEELVTTITASEWVRNIDDFLNPDLTKINLITTEHITFHSCEGVTEESLLNDGYVAYDLTNEDKIYLKTTETLYSLVYLSGDICIECPIGDIDGRLKTKPFQSNVEAIAHAIQILDDGCLQLEKKFDSFLDAVSKSITNNIWFDLSFASLEAASEFLEEERGQLRLEVLRYAKEKLRDYTISDKKYVDILRRSHKASLKLAAARNLRHFIQGPLSRSLGIIGVISDFREGISTLRNILDLYMEIPEDCPDDKKAWYEACIVNDVLCQSEISYYRSKIAFDILLMTDLVSSVALIPETFGASLTTLIAGIAGIGVNMLVDAGHKKVNEIAVNAHRHQIQTLQCYKDKEPEMPPAPNDGGGSGPGSGGGKKGDPGKRGGKHHSGNKDKTHVMDPSGYVYEAVSTNRLAGVTATAYYKETLEDMYGDLYENVVKWDASEYAQENPLFTDENGMYAWDVPQGLWQVKFEKEGYETTCSEWLPVPPPQLEVNIGMKQNVQPYVKAAHAYEDAVEVEFDKYMMSELLTLGNIIVQVNGKAVDGIVQLLNEEKSYEGKNDTYASKIRFNAAKPFPAREVSLRVSNHVKSYAGVRMQEDYMQTFTVEKELTKIVCDSVMTVPYGETVTVPIAVMPAAASAGKTLRVRTSSSMILSVEASELRIDEKGMAYITVVGELPGTSALAFSVADDKLTGATIVNVVKTGANIVAPREPLSSLAVKWRRARKCISFAAPRAQQSTTQPTAAVRAMRQRPWCMTALPS